MSLNSGSNYTSYRRSMQLINHKYKFKIIPFLFLLFISFYFYRAVLDAETYPFYNNSIKLPTHFNIEGKMIELPEMIEEICPGEENIKNILPSVEKYTGRNQFIYLMTDEEEVNYYIKLITLLKDEGFINKFKLARDEKGLILDGYEFEKASFGMALHFYKSWSEPVSSVNTVYNVPVSFSFDFPYRRIYDTKQAVRYYIKKYPNGDFIVPALILMAKCNIIEENINEAVISYEYALKTTMEQNGIFEPSLHSGMSAIAENILNYSSRYGDTVKIKIRAENEGTNSNSETLFKFDREEKIVDVNIRYGF